MPFSALQIVFIYKKSENNLGKALVSAYLPVHRWYVLT
jgi:hypothetical protein